MIGQTLGHYRVLEQIGAGGMGLVFRAHDERLDRDVALKVLTSGTLTDDNARKRFRKEALSLSQLNHPNIETVHDFDTQEGVDFLVMELIAGISLDEKLAARPLTEKEILALGIQLAQGLEAAHEQGVIHRDLKPGNLRLTGDGRLKILDFGLAKLLRPVSDTANTESLSQTKGVAGTLPYMAPEQLRGEKVDARSDLYAAGAVLYEMATGRRPFAGSGASLIDAILNQKPPAPRALNPRISPALEGIILKALDKDPDQRQFSARELLVNLQRTSAGTTAVAAGVAQANRWSRSRILGTLISIAVIIACLIAGWRVYLERTAVRVKSIAVLPLVNGSGDPNMEYLSDGITESLIDKLSEIPRLRVMAPATIFTYKGRQVDPREVGRTLGVATVLQGKVTKFGDTLRIKVDLVDAAQGTEIWGEEYNPKTADILAIQAEISREIASQLRLRLSGEEQKRLAKRYTENGDAYQAYLKGRYYSSKYTEEGLEKGIEYFQEAIKIDPNYALAYAGLTVAYWNVSNVQKAPTEVMPKAKEAALKALELDPDLAESHAAMALVKMAYDWDRIDAEKEFKRAIELNPGYALVYEWHGWHLALMGRLDESVAELRRAEERDPFSPEIRSYVGLSFYWARQNERAIEELQKAVELDPNFWWAHVLLGWAHEQNGNLSEAVKEFNKARALDDNPWILADLGHVYAVAGRRGDAQRALDMLNERAKRRYVSAYFRARIYTGLGDKEQAFKWLEKAYENRDESLTWLKVDPFMDSLHSDPRFSDLLRRLGLLP